MPASDVIRRRAIPLTVTRPTQEVTQYGFTTQEGTPVAGVTGHMQVVSDKEQRFMPEGLNTMEAWNIWSLDELRVGDQVTDGTAPLVTVVRFKFWKEGKFYHAQGVLVDDSTALTAVIAGTGAAIVPPPVGAAVAAHP